MMIAQWLCQDAARMRSECTEKTLKVQKDGQALLDPDLCQAVVGI